MGEITDYLNLKDYEVDGADLIALISNLNHQCVTYKVGIQPFGCWGYLWEKAITS